MVEPEPVVADDDDNQAFDSYVDSPALLSHNNVADHEIEATDTAELPSPHAQEVVATDSFDYRENSRE